MQRYEPMVCQGILNDLGEKKKGKVLSLASSQVF